MKNSLSVALINRLGQATIMSKMRKNSIDNICPPTSLLAGKKRGFSLRTGRKSEGKKGVCGGCGNVVNAARVW